MRLKLFLVFALAWYGFTQLSTVVRDPYPLIDKLNGGRLTEVPLTEITYGPHHFGWSGLARYWGPDRTPRRLVLDQRTPAGDWQPHRMWEVIGPDLTLPVLPDGYYRAAIHHGTHRIIWCFQSSAGLLISSEAFVWGRDNELQQAGASITEY